MNDRARQSRESIARVLLTGALAILGLWVAWGFLPALIWAVVIAIAIDPLYLRLRTRWPGRAAGHLLPVGMTLAVALLIVVPIAIGVAEAAREAYDVLHWMTLARVNGVPVPAWVDQLPVGRLTVADWWQAHLATPEGATMQLNHLNNSSLIAHSRLIGSSLIHRSMIFAFTLLALFFLLRERETIIGQCRIAGDRLLGPAGERIGRQAVRSVRGTIDGLVLVGIGEGAVMALAYLMLGVPHPLLLGGLTAVAAMIPFGAALMFAVAALLLMGQGAAGAAIAVIIIGLIVLGIADHFVRPVLIGSATRLPFLWVLIGILGGVEAFGLLGLFVGPATMAVLVMLWREYLHDAPAPDLGATP